MRPRTVSPAQSSAATPMEMMATVEVEILPSSAGYFRVDVEGTTIVGPVTVASDSLSEPGRSVTSVVGSSVLLPEPEEKGKPVSESVI